MAIQLVTVDEAERRAGDSQKHSEAKDRPVLLWLEEVTPKPVTWLWPERIPAGKVTPIDGDPGLGKSTVAFDLCARISTGSAMPDGSCSQTDIGGAVILTAEDGESDDDPIRAALPGALAGGGEAARRGRGGSWWLQYGYRRRSGWKLSGLTA